MGGIKKKYNMKAVFDNLNRKQHGSDVDTMMMNGLVKEAVHKAVRNASLKSNGDINKEIKQTTFNLKSIDKSATHQASKRSGRGS